MSNRKKKLNGCICSGKSLDRMLRPAILTVLCGRAQGLHGYAIEKSLQVFKFFQNQPPDYTGLYRLLKQMEAEEILSSTESVSMTGPSKRLYRLSGRGKKCLSRWLDSLWEYQEMIDDLLAQAKKNMETHI